MRSFLTVLGVIIGTGAVIGVGSIIAGLDGAITGLFRGFGPNTIIVTKTTAMGNSTREEREPQAADFGKRPRHRGALSLGGAREPLPDARRRHAPGPLQGQRLLQHPDGRHGRGLRVRRHHHEVRPLLHRYGKLASHARGGDRRGYPEAPAARRGPGGQMDRCGRPRVRSGRRDGPARRRSCPARGQPRPASVLHHAQDVPQREGAHADRDRLSRHGGPGPGRDPRACCGWSAACRSMRPTTSPSPPPSR